MNRFAADFAGFSAQQAISALVLAAAAAYLLAGAPWFPYRRAARAAAVAIYGAVLLGAVVYVAAWALGVGF